jgi:hypothetical protein
VNPPNLIHAEAAPPRSDTHPYTSRPPDQADLNVKSNFTVMVSPENETDDPSPRNWHWLFSTVAGDPKATG